MIILTRRMQDKALAKLAANEIIFRSLLKQCDITPENVEAMEYYVENDADVAYALGGLRGMVSVLNTIDKYSKEADVENSKC